MANAMRHSSHQIKKDKPLVELEADGPKKRYS